MNYENTAIQDGQMFSLGEISANIHQREKEQKFDPLFIGNVKIKYEHI